MQCLVLTCVDFNPSEAWKKTSQSKACKAWLYPTLVLYDDDGIKSVHVRTKHCKINFTQTTAIYNTFFI